MSSEKREATALSDGYCLTTIGEVIEARVSQEGPTQDFTYLDIGSVDRDSKAFFDLKVVPKNEAPSRAKQVVQPADVLVSMTRPNLNAVAMVTTHAGEAIASTGFHVLRSPWLDPKFLFYLVQSEDFVQAMTAMVQGALYPAVRPRDIDSFQFRMPPREEQSRIVEKLEELLSDLDAGVAELKTAQRKLAQYRHSLLKAAVEGALTADWRTAHNKSQETGAQLLQRILSERRARWEQKQLAKFAEQGKEPPNGWQAKYAEPVSPDLADLPSLPEGWTWASLDQLAEIQGGIQKQPSRTPVANRYPFLRVANVARGQLKLDEIHEIELFEGELGRLALQKGDILVVEGNGSLTEIGRCALWDGSIANAVHQNHLIRARPVLVKGEFIEAWLNSLRGIQRMTALAATTSGLYTLSVGKISKIPVPLPPLSEQDAAIESLSAALSGCREQMTATERLKIQAAAQRKNILKAAFAGQLVQQDPNDEPASELLARIRAARASNESSASRRRRKSA